MASVSQVFGRCGEMDAVKNPGFPSTESQGKLSASLGMTQKQARWKFGVPLGKSHASDPGAKPTYAPGAMGFVFVASCG